MTFIKEFVFNTHIHKLSIKSSHTSYLRLLARPQYQWSPASSCHAGSRPRPSYHTLCWICCHGPSSVLQSISTLSRLASCWNQNSAPAGLRRCRSRFGRAARSRRLWSPVAAGCGASTGNSPSKRLRCLPGRCRRRSFHRRLPPSPTPAGTSSRAGSRTSSTAAACTGSRHPRPISPPG